jgi:signal transduction histidine kinase
LGLPICRRIVQEHQGNLNIVSTVQQGTTVFITLPTQHGQDKASFIEA